MFKVHNVCQDTAKITFPLQQLNPNEISILAEKLASFMCKDYVIPGWSCFGI